ncbi:MAG: hypothetical protein ACHQQP_00270 [Gemmatimonadales bacterium]
MSGLLVLTVISLFAARNASGQRAPDCLAAQRRAPDSTNHTTPDHYWRNIAAGFATSILAHEAGHIGMSYALGARPTFGFEDGKPTVFSGIDASRDPHKQFLFSSAGLDVQAIMDEAILDLPHHRGSLFERGILAGGIATAYFYATIGRNARNSDITYIAQTSSLSRTEASLIYAGLATIQTIRIAHDGHYANFFVRPSTRGGVNLGVALLPSR